MDKIDKLIINTSNSKSIYFRKHEKETRFFSLAGLAAAGTTEVLRVYHPDRGYQRLEEKLCHPGRKHQMRNHKGVLRRGNKLNPSR